MPRAKQVTAWVEDRPGMLGRVAAALGAKKVNIVAFMAPVIGGRGALRMIVDKPAMARKILVENSWETTEEEVLEVLLPDKPGSRRREHRVRLYRFGEERAARQHLLRRV